MSTRSELLFRAHGKISNPFLLCTLIGKRTGQWMMSGNRKQSTAEIVDYALSELLAGAKSKAPLSQSHLNAASIEVLEVEAR